MKNNFFLVVFVFISVFCLSSFSKPSVDYTECEEFINAFYMNDANLSFDKIKEYFYDDKSCVRVDVVHHESDSKKYTNQLMIFVDDDIEDITALNNILLSLGKVKDKQVIYESVENIADIPVPNLICIQYKIKYENQEADNRFWLKKINGKIRIYEYSVYFHVDD